MRSVNKLVAGAIAAALPVAALVAILLPITPPPRQAAAATIGGADYAVQYDFREFWTATDGKQFQVILEGNPFPTMDPQSVARQLLPVMQAAKPRPALTFTYDAPGEKPRPYYRLVLVSSYANDLGADAVCQGVKRFNPNSRPGVFSVFAVYCRNDQFMSQTTAWTPATGPDDPRVGQLFSQLFDVVFSDSPMTRPNVGGPDMR